MRVGVRIAVTALCAWGATATAAPILTSTPPVGESGWALSDTGYFELRWTPDDAGVESDFVLEESRSYDFAEARLIYKGPHLSTVLSGFLDGEYYYRVRADGGAWATPLKVVVQHHSLQEAVTYLVIGAFVFLATAVLVIGGHRAHRREGRNT